MTYIDIVAWQLLWSFEPGRVRPGDGASFYFEAICFSRSILCKWRSMLWFSFESNIPHTSEFHVWGRRARLFRVSNASLKTPRPSWASRTRTYRSHRSLGPRGWTWEAIGEPISTPSCGRHFQGAQSGSSVEEEAVKTDAHTKAWDATCQFQIWSYLIYHSDVTDFDDYVCIHSVYYGG